MSNPINIQKDYYKKTAKRYDQMHVNNEDEHFLALAFMLGMLDFFKIRSVLDIGSGTGRALIELKTKKQKISFLGIEPSSELRKQGYKKGLKSTDLIDGDAQRLQFQDSEFDLVCAFGALHHIPDPKKAVSEMLRVSKKAIFISDSNNFGQGDPKTRLLKQIINAFGLWPVANFLKTKGKGYSISTGDGLYYSYSVFNNLSQIQQACKDIYFLNTKKSSPNLYKTASHIGLFAVK